MKITGNENIETEDEKHNRKESTNVEFVNGVHPLHWATSPGPSPMEPIQLIFKNWYTIVTITSSADSEQL